MNSPSGKAFSLKEGFQALSAESPRLWTVYLTVVGGIVAHWIWEVLVDGLPNGPFEFGSAGVIAARIVIAFIAGAFSVTGIWKQLEGVDPRLRFFAAFTQGFAVDALTAPVVTNIGQ
jgi:hypothetical protein